MRSFQNRLISAGIIIAVFLLPGLTLGSAAWAKETSTKDIVKQIENYAKTGDIYDAGAAEDLEAMLRSVDTAIAGRDKVMAQSLLAGFVRTVKSFDGKTISSAAASRLVSAADALSSSL
jgi:FIMAH domain